MKNTIYIDEAGRGPFAGPVYVGLVLPLTKFDQTIFNDSKKLSPTKRESLYKDIVELENQGKILFASGSADNKEIDKYGISHATFLAICRGVFDIISKYYKTIFEQKIKNSNLGDDFILDFKFKQFLSKKEIKLKDFQDFLQILDFNFILDGKTDYGCKKNLNIKITTIIDGDAKNKNISMASIIAKVERDDFVQKISKKYPNYQIDKHKGYGTKLHRELIVQHGASDFHRISFLQNMINGGLITQIDLPTREKLTKIKINNKTKIKVEKESLLLHVCCAPDLTYPIKFLKEFFDLHIFWYNPNISDQTEHKKRFAEYEKLLKFHKNEFKIFDLDYNPKEFFDYLWQKQTQVGYDLAKYEDFLKEIGSLAEGGKRCDLCYKQRLEKSAEICQKLGIKYFTTTLSISPKKNLDKLNEYGISAGKQNNVNFLFFDFRKNNGFAESIKICQELGIRRQNFCGCIWSKK